MKIICLKGGLGNQMFEYCRYRQLKEKNKNIYIYYDQRRLKQHNGVLISDAFDIILPQNSLWVSLSVILLKLLRLFHIAPYLYDDTQDNAILIDDYSQNSQFIQQAQDYFHFKAIDTNILSIKNQILQEKYAVALHIRRGDYLIQQNLKDFGICPMEYYHRAMEYMSKQQPQTIFYIFSDDITWCKHHVKGTRIIFVDLPDSTPDYASLYLMTLCKGHIIANSTFSFWGAYLSKNQGINIYPKKWFVNENWTAPDIFPKDWLPF